MRTTRATVTRVLPFLGCLLPLEMAQKIVRHDGWDLARVQQYLFDEGQDVASAPDAIHPIVAGGAGY